MIKNKIIIFNFQTIFQPQKCITKIKHFQTFRNIFKQCCGKLRKDAESCGKMRKVAESCGKMRKVAESCGMLHKQIL